MNYIDEIIGRINTPFDPSRPWDATALFSITNGNYNGDPDRGGRPRQDSETLLGQTTDVCLSHRTRMQIANMFGQVSPYRVLVVPETYRQDTYALAEKEAGKGTASVKWMCENYWDVRVFGAVMADKNKKDLGSLTGPIKFSVISNSIDPVSIMDISITTCAPAKDKKGTDGIEIGKKTDIGEKFAVPFALFKTHIWYIPSYGAKTGITSDDMMMFMRAFIGMFDFDRSTMRGEMALNALHLFRHDSELRNARFQTIRKLVSINKEPEVEFPRSIDDYLVEMNEGAVPNGVEHICLLNDWV